MAATEIGAVYLSVLPSARGFGKELNRQLGGASTQAGKLAGSRISSGIATMIGTAGGVLAAKGVSKIGETIGKTITSGISRYTSIENAEAKLRALGNSAADVDKIMSGALASVKGTAFGLNDAANTAAAAIASGIKPGAELDRMLRTVANTAAVAGIGMDEMGAIFNKVAASGKLQGDVLAQLSDRGVPALQLLAKHLGISAEEVSKLASQGKIDFKTFEAAMSAGMSDEAAKIMGDTLTGSMANVNAALSRVGATVVGFFAPAWKSGLDQAIVSIDAFEARIGPALSATHSVLTEVSTAVRDVFGIAPDITPTTQALAGVEAVANPVADALGAVGQSVAGIQTGPFAGALDAIRDGLTTVRGALDGIDFGAVVAGLSPFATILREALPPLVEIGRILGGVLLVALREIAPVLAVNGEAFRQLGLALATALTSAMPGIEAALGALGELAKVVLPVLSSILQTLIPTITGVIGAVAQFTGKLTGNKAVAIGLVSVIGTVVAAMKMWALGTKSVALAKVGATRAVKLFGIVTGGVKKIIGQAKWLLFLGQYAAYNVKQFALQTAAWVKDKAAMVAHKAAAAGRWVAGLAAQLASTVRQLALTTAAWVKDRAVMVAHKAATLASAAATKAMALGQRALNLAMRANPIGLIITGLTALAAGVVYLWKNSETFRNIVLAVWSAVKDGIAKVADWFTSSVLPALRSAYQSLSSGFTWMRDKISAAWTAIRDGASRAIEFLKALFLNFTGPGLLLKHWSTIRDGISRAWTAVKSATSSVFNWLKSLFLNFTGPGLIIQHWARITAAFTSAWRWIKLTFSSWWSGLATILRTPIDVGKRAIDRVLSSMKSAFSTTVNGIKTVWDGLKAGFKAPIKFAIDTVLNGGIIAAYNKLATWVPGLKKASPVSLPGFRDGGIVPGRFDPRNRDNVLGLTSAGVPIAKVEPGEMIINRAATRRWGHVLNAINEGKAFDFPAYASGGVVRPVPGGFGRFPSYPGHTGVDFPVPTGTPIHVVLNGIVKAVRSLTTSYGKHVVVSHPDAGGFETLYAHMSRFAGALKAGMRVLAGQVIGYVGSTGNSTGPHLHFTQQWPGGRIINPTALLNKGALASWKGSSVSSEVQDVDLVAEFKKFITKPFRELVSRFSGTTWGDMAIGIPSFIRDKVISMIPGLVAGGTATVSGAHWLSEDGRPELVVGPQMRNLHRGSTVHSADSTEALFEDAVRRVLDGGRWRIDLDNGWGWWSEQADRRDAGIHRSLTGAGLPT